MEKYIEMMCNHFVNKILEMEEELGQTASINVDAELEDGRKFTIFLAKKEDEDEESNN